jgi:hypothetical protein
MIWRLGNVGGGGGDRSTWRKPLPVPHCPPQNTYDVTWDRTRAMAWASKCSYVPKNLDDITSQMLHAQYYTVDDHHNEQELLHRHPLLPRAINKKWSLQKAHNCNSTLHNVDNLQGLDSSLILLKCYTERGMYIQCKNMYDIKNDGQLLQLLLYIVSESPIIEMALG